jgi:hypothetical protein
MSFFSDPSQLGLPARDRPSLMVFMTPITENAFDSALSFTGEIKYPDIRTDIPVSTNMFSTSGYYKRIWDLEAHIHTSFDSYYEMATPGPTLPPVSYKGQHYVFNPASGIYDTIEFSTGHRRPNASVRGAKAVWDAREPFFKPFDFGSLRLP